MVDIFDTSFDENLGIEVSDNKVSKGDDINLTAKDPVMTEIVVGVGWDLNAFDTDMLDLDMSCFLLDKTGKTRVNEDFVFYNNLETGDGAVVYNGDSRTGAGDGDDESISIKIPGVSFDIIKIMFVLSIYQGEEKEQSMAGLRNCYLRLINASNNQELLRYELGTDLKNSKETAMLVGSLNREGPKWHFEVVGRLVEGGLAKVAADYGIVVNKG